MNIDDLLVLAADTYGGQVEEQADELRAAIEAYGEACAADAVAKEREACAKACESEYSAGDSLAYVSWCMSCASAIRAWEHCAAAIRASRVMPSTTLHNPQQALSAAHYESRAGAHAARAGALAGGTGGEMQDAQRLNSAAPKASAGMKGSASHRRNE